MVDMDSLRTQWNKATGDLPWGVQRVFADVLTLASQEKTPSPLVYNQDYGDGGACLVNQAAQFLKAIGGEGGEGKPMASFGTVVSLFDQINREFHSKGINVDRKVSPLAADILLQWFAPLKDSPTEADLGTVSAAGVAVTYREPTDEEMHNALLEMLTTPAPLTETPFDTVNEDVVQDI